MEASQRVQRLCTLLLVKALLCLLVRGTPAWLSTAGVLALLDVEMPEDPVLLRSFGALRWPWA